MASRYNRAPTEEYSRSTEMYPREYNNFDRPPTHYRGPPQKQVPAIFVMIVGLPFAVFSILGLISFLATNQIKTDNVTFKSDVVTVKATIDAMELQLENLALNTSVDPFAVVPESKDYVPIHILGYKTLPSQSTLSSHTFTGAAYYIYRDVTCSAVLFSTTSNVTSNSNLTIVILQGPEGTSQNETSNLITTVASGSLTGISTNNVNYRLNFTQGEVTLRSGIIYVLFGSGAGSSAIPLQVYKPLDIGLLNGSVYAGTVRPSFDVSTILTNTTITTLNVLTDLVTPTGGNSALVIRLIG